MPGALDAWLCWCFSVPAQESFCFVCTHRTHRETRTSAPPPLFGARYVLCCTGTRQTGRQACKPAERVSAAAAAASKQASKQAHLSRREGGGLDVCHGRVPAGRQAGRLGAIVALRVLQLEAVARVGLLLFSTVQAIINTHLPLLRAGTRENVATNVSGAQRAAAHSLRRSHFSSVVWV